MRAEWNDSAVNALKEMFAAGKSTGAITLEINSQFGTNRTTNSIQCKLASLGLKVRGAQIIWGDEENNLLLDLFKDPAGMSYGVIAARMSDKFGVTFSRDAVIGRANRLGLQAKGRSINLTTSPVIRRERTPRPTKVSPSVERLRCVELVPLNLTLADLPENGCRYIAGDDYLYCGHPRQDKSSYCTPHHHLVWVKPISNAPKARKYHGTNFAGRAA
jgi:GcrA cell cycle regulator